MPKRGWIYPQWGFGLMVKFGNMEKFSVLSLFDGISCGRLALERAGIPVAQYFASEIDKHAIKVAQKNWPENIQLGDVQNIKGVDLPKVEIILAGSPCQGFSFCGKQLNFNDPRSKLFWEFVRLLKECSPKYFLLENVPMKKEYSDIITKELGVNYISINSSLVSAQNRLRWYWTNIPNVTQPEDKNIMLIDILDADYDGIWVWPRGVNDGGVKDYNGKSPTLTTSSRQYNFLLYRDEKSEPKFSKEKLKAVGYINKKHFTNKVYDSEGKSPTLLAQNGGIRRAGNALVLVKDKIRRFTINEVEELQNLPRDYTEGIPLSQRFKCCGNSWTVDIISHILKGIGEN